MDQPINDLSASNLGSAIQPPPPESVPPSPPPPIPQPSSEPPLTSPPPSESPPENPNPPDQNSAPDSDGFVVKPPKTSPALTKNINFKKILPVGGLTLLGIITVTFTALLVSQLQDRQILIPKAAMVDYSCECVQIKAYNTSWEPVAQENISSFIAGQTYRFSVDPGPNNPIYANFRINDQADSSWCQGTITDNWCKTTSKKPDSKEFYIEFTVPTEGGTFTVKAENFCQKDDGKCTPGTRCPDYLCPPQSPKAGQSAAMWCDDNGICRGTSWCYQ